MSNVTKFRPQITQHELLFLVDAVAFYLSNSDAGNNPGSVTTGTGLLCKFKKQVLNSSMTVEGIRDITMNQRITLDAASDTGSDTGDAEPCSDVKVYGGKTISAQEIAYKKYSLLGAESCNELQTAQAIEYKILNNLDTTEEEKAIYNKYMMSRL